METEDREGQDGGGDYGGSTAWGRPRYGSPEDVHSPPRMHEVAHGDDRRDAPGGDGSVGRVVAIVISVGLAWATIVTLAAWILGRLLARSG